MSEGLKAVRKSLENKNIAGVEAFEWRRSVVLAGKVKTWDAKIEAGYCAVKKGYKGVVNDIEVEGIGPDRMSLPACRDGLLEGRKFDIVVIGGGIIGSAVARELSRYDIRIALLEKEEDLAKHASSRNDGMIHPGFASKPHTLKTACNIRGNAMYARLSKELGFEFRRVGSLILYSHSYSKTITPLLMERCIQNGVEGYEYVKRKRVFEMEPYVTGKQHGAFYLPTTGVISPYRATIAFAQNAIRNGVEVFLETAVTGFEMAGNKIRKVLTNRGDFEAALVVNAAGVWADTVACYANDRFFSIHGRRGTDAVLDVRTGRYQTAVLAMPSFVQVKSKTKGGGLVTTVEGNLIAGPTAEEIPYREDYATHPEDLVQLRKHLRLNTKVGEADIINYFAGVRACTYEEDFVIEASEYVPNLVHAAGIQSPGVASAPAIAEDVAMLAVNRLQEFGKVMPRKNFDPRRERDHRLSEVGIEEWAKIVRKNPDYGRIVCRCESVSEGEVRSAIRSAVPATTLDGVKRRTRAGMGRCHGGFCTPRVMEILSGELDVSMTSVTKKGTGSELLVGETKSGADYSDKKTKPVENDGA